METIINFIAQFANTIKNLLSFVFNILKTVIQLIGYIPTALSQLLGFMNIFPGFILSVLTVAVLIIIVRRVINR